MSKTKPHPVLDASLALRISALTLGLTCLDDEFSGWNVEHRFVCPAGHLRRLTPSTLCRSTPVCRECKQTSLMQSLRAAAASTGCECLDLVWRGASAKYRFCCAHGHQWMANALTTGGIVRGARCPMCLRASIAARYRQPDGLQRLRDLAAERGGECLSDTYLGGQRHHAFRCAEGHEWQAQAQQVVRGAWCGTCASKTRGLTLRLSDGLARLQQAAAAHGGMCTSSHYTTVASHYGFRCKEGHEWSAIASNVLAGRWCMLCGRAARVEKIRHADGLTRLQAAARKRGGVCLSMAYGTGADRYRLRCAQGHEWDATGYLILEGTWCGVCARETLRSGIDAARAIALERGGKCLSVDYVNNTTPLQWQCRDGHDWFARHGDVKRGSWCPTCNNLARAGRSKYSKRPTYDAARNAQDAT